MSSASLRPVSYSETDLLVLDQLQLPHKEEHVIVKNTNDGWNVIRKMQVRGAPAIAIVGCLSLVEEIKDEVFSSADALVDSVVSSLNYLVTARPTAVNMKSAADMFTEYVTCWRDEGLEAQEIKERLIASIHQFKEDDTRMCRDMARHCAEDILRSVPENESATILTHCVVRTLAEMGRLERCFCTETRPYLQGARLTAYELTQDGLPATLITDSMAAALLKQHRVSAVVVGADRIVANGDTANKIGTYQLAIVAAHHGVPFYVVAPSTTVDLSLASGDLITIEERCPSEVRHAHGVRIAPDDINVWNPAFDVTPAALITGGIVTELGLFKVDSFKSDMSKAMPRSPSQASVKFTL